MSNFKLQYISTHKEPKCEEPFLKLWVFQKKVSCYESSLVVCLASLETPPILFTSWIMTNFVTVEKNPVYISSMSHTKHSVKKKDSFLSLFFFWLGLLLQSLFMPYGNIVVCHSIITRGLLLDMWQQWAQSKHNRNEGSVTRPRAVGRFENPGVGGPLKEKVFTSIPAFIWKGEIPPPPLPLRFPTELLDSRPPSLLLQVRSLSWEHANSNKFGGLALLRFVLL